LIKTAAIVTQSQFHGAVAILITENMFGIVNVRRLVVRGWVLINEVV
jgi:hypothetical protein